MNTNNVHLKTIHTTKAFDACPRPIGDLVNTHPDLSVAERLLFLTYIYPRASFNLDKFVAFFRLDDIQSFLRSGNSTARRHLDKLQKAGLIVKQYKQYEQKRVLIGALVTIPERDAEIIIHQQPNRCAGSSATPGIHGEAHDQGSPLPVDKKVCKGEVSPDSDQSQTLTDERYINNSVLELDKITNNTPKAIKYSSLRSEDPDKIVASILNVEETTKITKTLSDQGYGGRAGQRLLQEIAFSLLGGTWRTSKSKAIQIMLQMINTNTWRTPYYFKPPVFTEQQGKPTSTPGKIKQSSTKNVGEHIQALQRAIHNNAPMSH